MYLAAGLPVQAAALRELGVSADQASAWFFITWLTTGAVSIGTAFYFKQPVSINLSIPALVLMVAIAGDFTLPQLLAANLTAGVLATALGVTGISGRLVRCVPTPIVMGMFAGTMLGLVSKLVSASFTDFVVVGPAVGGYLAGRALGGPRTLPLALAALCGAIAVLVTGQATLVPVEWQFPHVSRPALDFTVSGFIAITLPIVLLTAGTTNVQSIGFLQTQGYRVRANVLAVIAGLTSVVNSLFGGHAAAVGGTSIAVAAGPAAGPARNRYRAILVAGVPTLAVAVAAVPVIAAVGTLPLAFLVALAGLAVLTPFQVVFHSAFGGELRFGALVAFLVTVTGSSFAGIPPAAWALLAGVLTSLATERSELASCWVRSGHR
jgi:benzoate membrane transport protein